MIQLFFFVLKDGFFAAIAAIGFSSISNLSVNVFSSCAAIAAIGHMTRYILMNIFGFSLITGSSIAGLIIGILSIPASRWIKVPSECITFPALLPMVPGMYAYRTIQALMDCLSTSSESECLHYLYLLEFNWMTCMATIIGMVIGASLPVFAFKKTSFNRK